MKLKKTISSRIVLHFSKQVVDQPIICRLARDFNLQFNILKAYVTPEEEGLLVMELRGGREDYEKGMRYLAQMGVRVQPLEQNVIRDEAKCTHCGACVTVCPTGAFSVEPYTRKVSFSYEKCITCGLCIRACPMRAMEVKF